MSCADRDDAATRETDEIRLILGKPYRRIRYQQERGYGGTPRPTACHDCRAEAGELHMVGCEVEECPSCHQQAISCGCDAFGVDSHRWATFEAAAREMPEQAARYLLTLLQARLDAGSQGEGGDTR